MARTWNYDMDSPLHMWASEERPWPSAMERKRGWRSFDDALMRAHVTCSVSASCLPRSRIASSDMVTFTLPDVLERSAIASEIVA